MGIVKVRLQSQSTDGPLAFAGPLDCSRQTYVKEGWRGLYRVGHIESWADELRSLTMCRFAQGLSAPLFGAACENATLFLVYNKFQDLIVASGQSGLAEHGLSEKAKGKRRELTTPELAMAAAGAGSVASFVL